tara:strand:- start:500 stop:832 length:333 start_codon:yes stop_codon:yes gene_type:complete
MSIISGTAQSFGSIYNGRRSGQMGGICASSFFSAKPLGCYGDGGAIFTNDVDIENSLGSIRVHGKGIQKYDNVRIGLNARLDTLQTAILFPKLAALPDELVAREIAMRMV